MPRRAPVYAPPEVVPSGADLCADGLLRVKDAAAFAWLSVRTVGELIRTKKLPSAKVCGRRLVPKRALVEWLGRHVGT